MAAMSRMHIPTEPSGHFTPVEQTGGGSTWSLNRFMQLNPHLFSGTTDPMEANRWMVDVRKILTTFECPKSRQVTFATFLLRGEAEEWWIAIECMMPDCLAGEYITWTAFSDSFDQKYFFASLRFELTREFTQLRVISDDAARADQFKMGLRIEIRKQVNIVKNLTYAELVESAGIAERDLLEERSQH
ncbi:uncharacterized protein [Typha angustifolia]|uniref:uncharacterized protein n=1 Tax=Typha angustifolia TaxID=59011 RepID=UPI003C2D252F